MVRVSYNFHGTMTPRVRRRKEGEGRSCSDDEAALSPADSTILQAAASQIWRTVRLVPHADSISRVIIVQCLTRIRPRAGGTTVPRRMDDAGSQCRHTAIGQPM